MVSTEYLVSVRSTASLVSWAPPPLCAVCPARGLTGPLWLLMRRFIGSYERGAAAAGSPPTVFAVIGFRTSVSPLPLLACATLRGGGRTVGHASG